MTPDAGVALDDCEDLLFLLLDILAPFSTPRDAAGYSATIMHKTTDPTSISLVRSCFMHWGEAFSPRAGAAATCGDSVSFFPVPKHTLSRLSIPADGAPLQLADTSHNTI